ncbi:MAG: hypothetical protein ABW202_00600 [Duganella sp.]
MPTVPVGDSTRRLIAAVKKLESTLHTAGLPRWMARMPVWWLCWHYCRTLDQKIARMQRIARKFDQWLPSLRAADGVKLNKLEFIDIDRTMRDDIEATKRTMCDLRAYCVEVARMFDQLGYQSAGLRQRQNVFLAVLDNSCMSASAMQEALASHDQQVLALLQASQIDERPRHAVARA